MPGTKPHDLLDHCAVVPAAVEYHQLPCMRELFNIAFHMKLGALYFGRFPQSKRPVVFFVHIPRNTANSAPLARCIAPIEQEDRLLTGVLKMGLQLDELGLIRFQKFALKMAELKAASMIEFRCFDLSRFSNDRA